MHGGPHNFKYQYIYVPSYGNIILSKFRQYMKPALIHWYRLLSKSLGGLKFFLRK
jgi:hypothetical protein